MNLIVESKAVKKEQEEVEVNFALVHRVKKQVDTQSQEWVDSSWAGTEITVQTT